MPIVFTLDLEDHRPGPDTPPRYPGITSALLDHLDDWGVTGTVFVVGDVVAESPDLVRRISERGHELGLHGASHTALPDVGPDRFRRRTEEARARLADLTGTEVVGFRAPIFSLVPDSAWAPEILGELGFRYSSSVLPARNPLYGWVGAPREPFRWPNGVVEVPCPVFGLGPVRLPLLGGTYLRISPRPVTRWAQRRLARRGVGWLYAHPYDFDPEEPRWRVPEVGRLGSPLLWWNRRSMGDRVRELVEGSRTTLAELAATLGEAPVFDPEVHPV